MFEVLQFSKELAIIECRLIEWGRWEHYRVQVQRAVSPAGMLINSNSCTPRIADDEAELIHSAIDVLKGISPQQGRAVEACFIRGRRLTLDELSEILGVSRTKSKELLRGGLLWLQGYFYALAVAA